MRIKIKMNTMYYFALYIYILNTVVLYGGITDVIPFWQKMHVVLGYVSIVLIFFHIKRNLKWMTKHSAIYASIMFISSWISYKLSKREDIFFMALFIIGAIGTDFMESAKVILKAQITALIIIFTLCFGGLIHNTIIVSDRVGGSMVRYSMGFAHPNTLAALIFQIIALIIYINREKIKLPGYIALGAVTILGYKITYSRTSLVASLILLVVAYSYKIFSRIGAKKIWNVVSHNVVKIILLIGMILSIYLAKNYNNFEGWISFFINYDTISVRLKLLNIALSIYGLTPFGQEVNIVNSIGYFSNFDSQSAVLDNSFVFMLIVYGVINTIWFLLGYFKSIKYAQKNIDWAYMICVVSFIAMAFTEKYLVSLMYNFTVLMIGQRLYSKSNSAYKRGRYE